MSNAERLTRISPCISSKLDFGLSQVKRWPKPPTRETADEMDRPNGACRGHRPGRIASEARELPRGRVRGLPASGLLEQAIKTQDMEKISEGKEYVEKTRSEAFTLIDEAKQAMRDELATLRDAYAP
jgi:hypothetical protein